jgi:hypothetical protein
MMEVKKENWVYLKWPNCQKPSKITSTEAEICNEKLDHFTTWIGDREIIIRSFDDLKMLASFLNDAISYIEGRTEKTKKVESIGFEDCTETMERKLRPEDDRLR